MNGNYYFQGAHHGTGVLVIIKCFSHTYTLNEELSLSALLHNEWVGWLEMIDLVKKTADVKPFDLPAQPVK